MGDYEKHSSIAREKLRAVRNAFENQGNVKVHMNENRGFIHVSKM